VKKLSAAIRVVVWKGSLLKKLARKFQGEFYFGVMQLMVAIQCLKDLEKKSTNKL
jgi:hypothetical protein